MGATPGMTLRQTVVGSPTACAISIAKFIRHVAKSSKHCGASNRIASANECYGTGMAKNFPKAFGAFYRRSRAGALKGFARNAAVASDIEWQSDKMSNFTHTLSTFSFARS